MCDQIGIDCFFGREIFRRIVPGCPGQNDMKLPDAFCNRRRKDQRRLTDERMERMIAAFEPVSPDEGFTAIFDDSATVSEILESLRKEIIHEYCDQAR